MTLLGTLAWGTEADLVDNAAKLHKKRLTWCPTLVYLCLMIIAISSNGYNQTRTKVVCSIDRLTTVFSLNKLSGVKYIKVN